MGVSAFLGTPIVVLLLVFQKTPNKGPGKIHPYYCGHGLDFPRSKARLPQWLHPNPTTRIGSKMLLVSSPIPTKIWDPKTDPK